jgi:predicted ATPase
VATLPAPLTPFVGRTAELGLVVDAVRQHRLVTATGPGGVGKTRLALAAARALADDHRDGVAFIDLVKVASPDTVLLAVAEALEVHDALAARGDDVVFGAVADREALVVVDNCEHLADRARVVIERMLTACPGLRVLATSRIRLMLPFEHVFDVPGLSVGDDGGDAAALFTDRMLAAGAPAPTDAEARAAIRAICEALGGTALAIELAAARVPSLGLEGLRDGLDSRLELLAVGARAHDRHSSMRAAIEWTYDLLGDDERELLLAIAVFSAPFDVASVVAVSGWDGGRVVRTLATLVDWNLLSLRGGPPARYRMLETIRQYATELSHNAGTADLVRQAHAAWCHQRLAQLLAEAPGAQEWCDAVDQLLDDARAALAWAGATPGQATVAAGLAELLAEVSFERSHLAEAQQRYVAAAGATAAAGEQNRLLRLGAGAAATRNVGADTIELLTAAAAAALAAGEPGVAAEDLATAAAMLNAANHIMGEPVAPELAIHLLDRARASAGGAPRAEAVIAIADAWDPHFTAHSRERVATALDLAERSGDPLLICSALDLLTAVELQEGHLALAREAVLRRLAVMAATAPDARSAFLRYDVHHMACTLALATGDLLEARTHAEALAGLPFLREERHVGHAHLVAVRALSGDPDAAVASAEIFERDWIRAGRPVASNLAMAAYAAALAWGMLGNRTDRSRWVEITHRLLHGSDPTQGSRVGWLPTFDGLLALHHDDPHAALEALPVEPDDDTVWANPYARTWQPWYGAVWAEASVLAAAPGISDRLARAAAVTRESRLAALLVERATALATGGGVPAALAASFDELGCTYQGQRTRELIAAR